jgi:integrase
MAAITDPDEFAKLLNDLDHYDGSVITQYALRIAPLVFVRPGELRHAKWADIDLGKGRWEYTPPKTKKNRCITYRSIIDSSRSNAERAC